MNEREESIELLFAQYCKVVKANLTNDTFVCVKGGESNRYSTLSEWCRKFGETGVYHQDRLSFNTFTSINNLRKLFESCHSKRTVFRYRRLMDTGLYRWVSMTIFPCADYTPSNQTILIYVRDIQDDYCYQLNEYRKIQYLSTHDSETGYKNRVAFETDISNQDIWFNTIGIIRTENPGRLKELLDKVMPHADIYRVSENELRLLLNINGDHELDEFRKSVDGLELDYGFASTDEPCLNINRLIFEAEEDMYEQD